MHVLSTPPAFILSQDQTLRCRSNPFGRFTLKAVQLSPLHSSDSPQALACLNLTCSSPTALKPLSFKTVVGASFLQKGSKSAIRNFFPPVSPESQIRSHHPQTPASSKLRSREKANLTTRSLKQHSQLSLLSFFDGTSHSHCSFAPSSHSTDNNLSFRFGSSPSHETQAPVKAISS